MNLHTAVDDYLAECRARNLSKQTLTWYDQKLHAWATYQGGELEGVTAAHARAYLTSNPQWSDYTKHGYTQVIKGFLKWCEGEHYIRSGLAERLQLPKVEQVVIKTLSPDHIRRLHAAVDKGHYRSLYARDHAILDVLLGTGMRATELCTLTIGNAHITGDDCYLLLKSKGRKEREVGVPPKACTSLRRYLYRFRPDATYEEVFLGRDGRPMTKYGLDQLLERLEVRAGVSWFAGVRVSPHTFRHTFAVSYLQAGGDVYKLSKVLGHTTVTTTERYLRDYVQRNARFDGPDVLRAFS